MNENSLHTKKTVRSQLLSQIPRLSYAFGTAQNPDPLENFSEQDPVWEQVHAAQSIEVTHPQQLCGQVDALWSKTKGVRVSVRTADCTPILLAHRESKAVAAIHAGWRGTLARICQKLWATLKDDPSLHGPSGQIAPQDWVAVIGPTIGPCCYEVSPELAEEFKNEFNSLSLSSNAFKTKNPEYPPRHLDLPALNAAQLDELGIEVEILRLCTLCSSEPEFNSYRRGKKQNKTSHRQISGLVLL